MQADDGGWGHGEISLTTIVPRMLRSAQAVRC
jgi:hypothetical protein